MIGADAQLHNEDQFICQTYDDMMDSDSSQDHVFEYNVKVNCNFGKKNYDE